MAIPDLISNASSNVIAQVILGTTANPYVKSSVKSGSLEVLGTPAPTVDLYNSAGTAVWTGRAVTGYTTQPNTFVTVWYKLDTTGMSLDTYTMVFTYTVQDSVGVQDVLKETFVFSVTAAVSADLPYTYNPANAIGKFRLYAQDTEMGSMKWADPEVQVFLDLNWSDPLAAAIFGLIMKQSEYAQEALIANTATRKVDATKRAEAMGLVISNLQNLTIESGVVNSPEQVFRPYYSVDDPGTMEPW